MSLPTDPASREPSTGMKVVIVALLSFSAINVARLAYLRDPALKAPPLIGYVIAVTLLCAVAAVVVKMFGRDIGEWAALPILLGLASTSAWVAFSKNPTCRTTSNIPFLHVNCRVGFGFGAVVLLFMTWMLLRGWWRRARFAAERRPRVPRW